MKYPQLVSMPEALRIWLEDELEARGIDTVYSQQILSILQHKNLKDSSLQVNGIESLVDELRTKLKKLEGDKSEKHFGSCGSAPTCSLQDNFSFADPGLKFSELAFHTLENSEESTLISARSCPSPQNERKFPKCAFGRNLSNLSGGNKEKSQTSSRSVLKQWQEENKENQNHQASKEIVGTRKDDKMRSRSRSTVKQQQQSTHHKSRKSMAKSLDRKDDLLKVKVTTLDGCKARKLDLTNDCAIRSRSILSKLDCELKSSIWTPDKSNPTIIDDLDGCDENLPMDFEQLLESPADNVGLPLEFYYKKQINSFAGSFIQCGTNITSSIWTDNADMSMECSAAPESLTLNNNNSIDNILNDREGCNKDKERSTLSSMSGRSIWDENKAFSSYPAVAPSCNNSIDNKQQWSNGDNLFPDTPWRMALAYEGFLNLKGARWSDVEGTSLHINDGGKFYSAFGSNEENAVVIDTSLSALNHNREDSCFMEVVPNKLSRFEKYKNSLNSRYVGGASLEMKSIWGGGEVGKAAGGGVEEEDLLTSMKTHFQPIGAVNEEKLQQQQLQLEQQQRSVAAAAQPHYEDGTTFQISSSIEEVHFERSDSGALYLDADKSQKYREFREAVGIEYPAMFLPKFRVCQNEKFCQTELDDDVGVGGGVGQQEQEEEEEDVDQEEEEDFYFPGDEKQVEDCIERDAGSVAPATLITVDGWVATWPASIWSNDTSHSWCDVWSREVNGEARKAVQEQYTKLKDEILEEGEELLSNLSSMQDLLLNSDEPASAMHSSQAAALINFSRG